MIVESIGVIIIILIIQFVISKSHAVCYKCKNMIYEPGCSLPQCKACPNKPEKNYITGQTHKPIWKYKNCIDVNDDGLCFKFHKK